MYPASTKHNEALAHYLRRGYRIEMQTPEYTQLVRGRRPDHVLHLFLTIFTLGLWAIVWFFVALVSHEDRIYIPRT